MHFRYSRIPIVAIHFDFTLKISFTIAQYLGYKFQGSYTILKDPSVESSTYVGHKNLIIKNKFTM